MSNEGKPVNYFVIADYVTNKTLLDTVGPAFETFEYPILVIMNEEGDYTVLQYSALDQIFSSVVAIEAAKKASKPVTRGTKK